MVGYGRAGKAGMRCTGAHIGLRISQFAIRRIANCELRNAWTLRVCVTVKINFVSLLSMNRDIKGAGSGVTKLQSTSLAHSHSVESAQSFRTLSLEVTTMSKSRTEAYVFHL